MYGKIGVMSTENETPLIQIAISEIKQGDIFGSGEWVALEDASNLHDQYCSVKVRYRDGGVGMREWEDPNHQIEVERVGMPHGPGTMRPDPE